MKKKRASQTISARVFAKRFIVPHGHHGHVLAALGAPTVLEDSLVKCVNPFPRVLAALYFSLLYVSFRVWVALEPRLCPMGFGATSCSRGCRVLIDENLKTIPARRPNKLPS